MAAPRWGHPSIPYLVHVFALPLVQHQDRLLIHSPGTQSESHSNLPFARLAIAVAHGLGVGPPLGYGLYCHWDYSPTLSLVIGRVRVSSCH
jgi:hypothetical protein